MSEEKYKPTIVNVSFTKNERDLLSILDQLVKYDLATSRSAWLKDQIRRSFYDLRDKGILIAAEE